MTIRYTTPEEDLYLDPTGKARAYLASLKDTDEEPVPYIYATRSRTAWKEQFQSHLESINYSSNHQRYVEFNRPYADKFGAQGGRFSLNRLKELLLPFYDIPQHIDTSVLCSGIDYIKARIQTIRRFSEPVCITDASLRSDANGSLPYMGKKCDFLDLSYRSQFGAHVFPCIPGQRYQNLKQRPIFQDATSNVRYINPYLGAVREWVQCHLSDWFKGWINPTLVTGVAMSEWTRRDSFYAVEMDYEKCDNTFTKPLAIRVLEPWECLLDPVAYHRVLAYTEECFHQPLYLGDQLWTGEHSLFSGQGVTSDYETWLDLELSFSAIIDSGHNPKDFEVFAIGDDVTILCPDQESAENIYALYVRYAHACGMVISKTKSGIHHNQATFCRRLYYRELKRDVNISGNIYMPGAYPSWRTLNGIINPEKHQSTDEDVWINTFRRLDNLYGSPDFVPTVQFVISRAVKKNLPPIDSYIPPDWWDRLYGASWSLENSEVFRVLKSCGLY